MSSEAYVWIFLPGHAEAVVCGRVYTEADGTIGFVYGRSYRERAEAIELAPEGMSLGSDAARGRRPGALPGPIADAAPDAWGRYAIAYRQGVPADTLGDIDLLLAGHADRVGALDFSSQSTRYAPPPVADIALADLEAAARGMQEAQQLPQHLLDALMHGTTIGGARPKAVLRIDGEDWIAKFSSTSDVEHIVRWEAATLTLARHARIRVPEHRLESINGRDVLLVKRFDRDGQGARRTRHLMLSALTLLNLDDTEARLASYPDFSDILLRYARRPVEDRPELFRRMVFSILMGNGDDHAKNHACFWDGERLDLTPAYDLVPQRRVGLEGRQAMLVGEGGATARDSTLANALGSVRRFGLSRVQAVAIVDEVEQVVRSQWEACFAQHGVPDREVAVLRGVSVLSPRALDRA